MVNAMLIKAQSRLAHDNDYGWWGNEEKLHMACEQGYNVRGEYCPDVEAVPLTEMVTAS